METLVIENGTDARIYYRLGGNYDSYWTGHMVKGAPDPTQGWRLINARVEVRGWLWWRYTVVVHTYVRG